MHKQVEILLVDDSDADIMLMQEALKDAKLHNNLHVVKSGQSAIDFLRGNKQLNPKHIVPGLVLLDLNMPGMSGLDVLKVVKSDDKLKTTPVIIMTSSQEEKDIAEAYKLQANSYVAKPVDFDQLIAVMNTIEDFWLSVVELPTIK